MSVTEQDRLPREITVAGETPAQGRPRRGRPARAHILMTLAGLLTAVAVYVVLQDADPGQRVLVATTELQAGTVVPPDALAAVAVDVADDQATRLLPADQRDAVVGQVVANHLMPGDLVGRSDLRQPAAPEDRRAMALPVGREHAVAGDLRTGDRVDVIAVEDGVARYVATGLPVIASGGGDSLDDTWTLTVSVDEQGALALARAMADTDVTVTRATGATPADPDAFDGGVLPTVPDPDDGDAARRSDREDGADSADVDDDGDAGAADDADTGTDADTGSGA
jgi:Flp pilus assembly protein CpaB